MDRVVTAGPARSPRRAREIARTRQDILEAAARVFSRAGYHAATMQAIAREAGFTAASLYTYFESKEAIYEGLLADVKGRLLATFDTPAPAGLTFPQRLELMLQRQFQLVAERIDALRVIFDQGPPREGQHPPEDVLARAETFFAKAGRGDLRLPPAEAALVLYGLAHAYVARWFLGEQEPDPSRLAARVVDVFLHGGGKPGPR